MLGLFFISRASKVYICNNTLEDKQPKGKGGLCIEHGGTGSKCKLEGCDKQPTGKGGFCRKHKL